MAIISPFKKIFNWQLASEKIPYKVYTALLTQTGTNAPVAMVLENNIGNIIWTRSAPGEYVGTLSNAFVPNKTFAFAASNDGALSSFQIDYVSAAPDVIYLSTFDSTNTLSDDLLLNSSLEIRVYN